MEQLYDWETFWKEWHNEKAQREEDLYYQVAKTVNKKPMEKELFDAINNSIVSILSLSPSDNFIELCCGNGLCTYEFRDKVNQIVAVDFSPHLIEAAKEFKSAPNISYVFESVFTFLAEFPQKYDFVPNKFLMNDALAYFVPDQLAELLTDMGRISHNSFTFLIRGIPNDEQKWNYYNTEERKQRYLGYVASGDVTNDGMGRWWLPSEITTVCANLGLQCSIQNQAPPVSNYRMDVLIQTK